MNKVISAMLTNVGVDHQVVGGEIVVGANKQTTIEDVRRAVSDVNSTDWHDFLMTEVNLDGRYLVIDTENDLKAHGKKFSKELNDYLKEQDFKVTAAMSKKQQEAHSEKTKQIKELAAKFGDAREVVVNKLKSLAKTEKNEYVQHLFEDLALYLDNGNSLSDEEYAKYYTTASETTASETEENDAIIKFLLTDKDGKAILSKSKNAEQLEKNILAFAKKKGSVAGMEYNEAEFLDSEDEDFEESDEGLAWVTFDDVWNNAKIKKAKKG